MGDGLRARDIADAAMMVPVTMDGGWWEDGGLKVRRFWSEGLCAAGMTEAQPCGLMIRRCGDGDGTLALRIGGDDGG